MPSLLRLPRVLSKPSPIVSSVCSGPRYASLSWLTEVRRPGCFSTVPHFLYPESHDRMMPRLRTQFLRAEHTGSNGLIIWSVQTSWGPFRQLIKTEKFNRLFRGGRTAVGLPMLFRLPLRPARQHATIRCARQGGSLYERDSWVSLISRYPRFLFGLGCARRRRQRASFRSLRRHSLAPHNALQQLPCRR